MTIGVPEVFLGLAVAVYIFILVDRICKCFETCANHRMMSGMYSKMDPLIFKQMIDKMKET